MSEIKSDLVLRCEKEKSEALAWFEDLVICSKEVSGQCPNARYIRAAIELYPGHVPSFSASYVLDSTSGALNLYHSNADGVDTHERTKLKQILYWIAYNYPNGIRLVRE